MFISEEVKNNIIKDLESLVLKRFKDLKDLKKQLKNIFPNYNIEVNFADMSGIDGEIDYEIIGLLEKEALNVYCYFDLYFAKTRANEKIIVEVDYEFE